MNLIKAITCSLIFILFLTLELNAKSNYEDSKTFTESFEVNESTTIDLQNRRGNIEIIYREGSTAMVETRLTVKGSRAEDVQKVFDQFELEINKSALNIEVDAETNVQNWTRINTFFRNSNTIKFQDGSKTHDIDEIDVQMIIYLPKISRLSVDNKYHDILFSEVPCDLEVNLYSGKLKGNDIQGDLDLKLKYGTVKIGSFKEGDLDIYDSKFTSSSAGVVKFKSKYSSINGNNFISLDLDSHDDEITIGSIDKELLIDAKYSNIRMQSFKSAEIEGHDTDFRAKSGESLNLESKYGSFDFTDLKKVTLDFHDDDFDAESVVDLTIKESKYSDINIDDFSGSLKITSSHDDDIIIHNPINTFSGLSIEAKYSTLKFPLDKSVDFRVTADTKYGSLDIGNLEEKDIDKDGSTVELTGSTAGATLDSPKITIDAYDSKIDINQ